MMGIVASGRIIKGIVRNSFAAVGHVMKDMVKINLEEFAKNSEAIKAEAKAAGVTI
jgi:hypothetical protein